jgi:hypothetical protein
MGYLWALALLALVLGPEALWSSWRGEAREDNE